MKLSENLPVFLVLVLAFASFAVDADDTLTEFNWGGSCDGYDFCGTIEFCRDGHTSYGYREAGTIPCLHPGPVIRLKKGKNYQMTLRNHADSSIRTNLHTHGLHISGDGNSDDITRSAEGGHCLGYAWNIGSEQAEGTNWYHSHRHFSTAEHVSGGAVGPLIVNDSPSTLIPSGVQGKNPIKKWLKNEKLLMITRIGNGQHMGNGVSRADLSIVSGEWYRLRILVGTQERGEELEFFSSASTFPCSVRVVAHDGVFRKSVPGPEVRTYQMTGASRMDVAIKCVDKNLRILYGGDYVARLKVVDGATSSATPFAKNEKKWSPKRPYYLKDLRDESPNSKYTVNIASNNINGVAYDPDTKLRNIGYDKIHEWTINGGAQHPFHLHLYHMQVVTEGGCGVYDEGQWYDTIASDCKVRFRTADIGGRCVLHCHFLPHEDNGAMAWVNVNGGPSQPTTNPVVESKSCWAPQIKLPKSCTVNKCLVDISSIDHKHYDLDLKGDLQFTFNGFGVKISGTNWDEFEQITVSKTELQEADENSATHTVSVPLSHFSAVVGAANTDCTAKILLRDVSWTKSLVKFWTSFKLQCDSPRQVFKYHFITDTLKLRKCSSDKIDEIAEMSSGQDQEDECLLFGCDWTGSACELP